MEETKFIYETLIRDSLVLATVFVFFFSGRFLINKLEPASKRMADLIDKFMDDVAKPLIPVAAGAVEFLSVQGKSMEAWARSNQQLVDVVQESARTSKEYYEARMAQEKREREEQVGELRQQIRELEAEKERLTKENQDLKEKVKSLESALAGKQDKEKAKKGNK